jgi:hypothetical protein
MAGKKVKQCFKSIKGAELNTVIAYAASFMLSGVPPLVCESVLTELYSSVKKSIGSILH